MKELNALEPGIYEAGNPVQNTQLKNISVQKIGKRRTRRRQESVFEPSTALRLVSKQRWQQLFRTGSIFLPNSTLPIRVLIMFSNVAGQRLHVMVQQRSLQFRRWTVHN